MAFPRFHPWRLAIYVGWSGLALPIVACDKREQSPAEAGPVQPPAPAHDDTRPQAPVAKVEPPPIDGAVLDAGLYVQTCEPDCPDMLQEPGAAHCKSLELGGRNWRLPSKDEAGRFASLEISQTTGYHWTETAYAEDDAQVWIVDPSSDQPTTIPRDRKPFRVRCVSGIEPTGGPNAAE